MRQEHETLTVSTNGAGFYDITNTVRAFISHSGIESGLLTLLVQHTSASLTIQENADPDVCRDLTDALSRIAPESRSLYRHNAEGPDDMPAHIKSSLTDVSLSIPVIGGQMRLGTWQGVYLIEHRTNPHTRSIAAHVIGS